MSGPPPHLSLWVIYERPCDYPTRYVVREWRVSDRGAVPQRGIGLCDTLDEARRILAIGAPGRHRLDRHPDDDPVIVEVWV